MDGKKIYDELIKILLKKAKGFYYTEEQEDYEKAQIKSKFSENSNKNISFFDNHVTDNTHTTHLNDTLNKDNETEKNTENLILVKRKITKHYIPPDMLAVKILFENIKEKVNDNDLNILSDEELLSLRDKLLGELIDEN